MTVALALSVLVVSFPWSVGGDTTPLSERIAPPTGFVRKPAAKGSFAQWLRSLPVRPGRPQVSLHDGRLKGNQTAHHVVLDVDVGGKDLQQCADATMRLRAEYLRAADRADDICFRFTSGHAASWSKWRDGERPKVKGSKVKWQKTASKDGGYGNFRRYLDKVFMFAGTHSLEKELSVVRDASKIEAGDVFIRGGFPGHAVIVVDVVDNDSGGRMFMLAQSFMPAQQIHVLRNPANPSSPWFRAQRRGPLLTPEWPFDFADLRRFPERGCPPVR